ncbi:MAG TPA: Dabb family protein [Clostridiales bacterium]|nr:Dabb family protein [Clostridiales bacterium]
MVKHFVAWNFAEHLSEEERVVKAAQMKKELEGLKDLIPGVVSINVYLDQLSTSDSDLVLDSVFVDEEALKAYIVHPEHVRVGTNYVRPITCNRKCVDFVL